MGDIGRPRRRFEVLPVAPARPEPIPVAVPEPEQRPERTPARPAPVR